MEDSKQILLQQFFDQLRQKVCWSTIAGRGTGSHVSFRFGRKLLMEKPLKNPNLSEDERKYEGEFWIFIQLAAWRLEENGVVICGSTSPNGKGEAMLTGLKKLVGEQIDSYLLSQPVNDLSLYFTNQKVLHLFCSEMHKWDNYSVGGHELEPIVVGPCI